MKEQNITLLLSTDIHKNKTEQYKKFLFDMFDAKDGMGITIHTSPHYEVPTIDTETLKHFFPPEKIESTQKYILKLTSFLNDKMIIEDKFSRLPTEIQNEQREAKKKDLYNKYGDLFVENYETKNKLRSIHTTNICAALQLISLYSNQSNIKESANSTKYQILSLFNDPQKNINLYNNYSFEKKN